MEWQTAWQSPMEPQMWPTPARRWAWPGMARSLSRPARPCSRREAERGSTGPDRYAASRPRFLPGRANRRLCMSPVLTALRPGSSHHPRRYQPRRRHSPRCGRSAPSVVSSPWPGCTTAASSNRPYTSETSTSCSARRSVGSDDRRGTGARPGRCRDPGGPGTAPAATGPTTGPAPESLAAAVDTAALDDLRRQAVEPDAVRALLAERVVWPVTRTWRRSRRRLTAPWPSVRSRDRPPGASWSTHQR